MEIDELKAAGLLDNTRGVTYGTRGGAAETLLYDTEESDEALEPLVEAAEDHEAADEAEKKDE